MTDIDVIVTVGSRTDELAALHRRRREALRSAGYRPSFIYVVDGDVPQARDALASLARSADDACVIQLSRQFGETAAILAGFANTKAEQLMILPAFEQVEPESLPRALQALEDTDVVTVRRHPRCDTALRRGQSYVFEAFLRRVGSTFRDPGCTVHALRRTVLEETQLYGEQHGFLPLLAANVGFKVVEIDLRKSVLLLEHREQFLARLGACDAVRERQHRRGGRLRPGRSRRPSRAPLPLNFSIRRRNPTERLSGDGA